MGIQGNFRSLAVFALNLIFWISPLLAEELVLTAKLRAVASTSIDLEFTLNEPWHINSHNPNEPNLIPAELLLDGANPGAISYPEGHLFSTSLSDKPISVYEGAFTLRVTLDRPLAPGQPFIATFSYQGCTREQCAIPAALSIRHLPDPTATGGFVAPSPPSVGSISSLPSPSPDAGSGKISRMLDSSSLFYSLVFLFIFGLGLNLTPCVYPMVPITVGFFVQQGSNDFRRRFLLALSYFLALCLTYSSLGVFAATTGSLFGSFLQKRFVVVGVTALYIALGLSLLEFFEFNPPPALMNWAGGARAGYLGAGFMGMTVGIVAAPCVGPVLFALLTHVAKSQDKLLGFLYFFALSAGLGTPYLILGIFSSSLKKLPRAGGWMTVIRSFFAALLFGLAWHNVTPLLPHFLHGTIGWLLLAPATLFLTLQKWGASPSPWFRAFHALGAVGLFAGFLYMAIPGGRGIVAIEYGLSWDHGFFRVLDPAEMGATAGKTAFEPYSLARFNHARASGKPILIDFFAEWCAACKELEHRTFPDPVVERELQRFVRFKVDLTRPPADSEAERARQAYGVTGLPIILFFNSHGEMVNGAKVVGFVPPTEFAERLRGID